MAINTHKVSALRAALQRVGYKHVIHEAPKRSPFEKPIVFRYAAAGPTHIRRPVRSGRGRKKGSTRYDYQKLGPLLRTTPIPELVRRLHIPKATLRAIAAELKIVPPHGERTGRPNIADALIARALDAGLSSKEDITKHTGLNEKTVRLRTPVVRSSRNTPDHALCQQSCPDRGLVSPPSDPGDPVANLLPSSPPRDATNDEADDPGTLPFPSGQGEATTGSLRSQEERAVV